MAIQIEIPPVRHKYFYFSTKNIDNEVLYIGIRAVRPRNFGYLFVIFHKVEGGRNFCQIVQISVEGGWGYWKSKY